MARKASCKHPRYDRCVVLLWVNIGLIAWMTTFHLQAWADHRYGPREEVRADRYAGGRG